MGTRVTFLSPFDRLIHDRDRAEALWDFFYRLEMYVPKAKRVHGYYVLPILRGDRLIGRIEPVFDRKAGVLRVNGVFAEPGAPASAGPGIAGRGAKAREVARRRRDRVLPARARDVASLVQLSLADARRMAIAGQLLPAPRGTSILDVAKHIGYLQLDPTRAVERNHLLVLWSRLGAFEPRRAAAAARRARALRVLRRARPDGRLSAPSGHDASFPRLRGLGRLERAHQEVARRQLGRSAPDPRRVAAQRATRLARPRRYRRALLGVDRLDERPQPLEAARATVPAGQGARLRSPGWSAALGPARPGRA